MNQRELLRALLKGEQTSREPAYPSLGPGGGPGCTQQDVIVKRECVALDKLVAILEKIMEKNGMRASDLIEKYEEK